MDEDFYITGDVAFSGFLCFLYSPESLQRIELDERRIGTFSFDIPVAEAESLFGEWCAGTLVLTDPKSLWARQSHLGKMMRDMNRDGRTVWERGRSEAWWAAARAAGEQRRQEREEYEKRRNQPIAQRRH